MGRSNKNRNKSLPLGNIGRSAHFTQVRDDILESPAYLNLSNQAARLLTHVLKKWSKCSANDTQMPSRGISITWREFRFKISKRAFDNARNELQQQGFIEKPLDMETPQPGTPKRYVFSTKWQHVDDTTDAFKTHERTKSGRLCRERNRLLNGRENYLNNSGNGAVKL